MRKSFGWVVLLLIALGSLGPPSARAQEEKKAEGWKFFKLDFVVRELEDGKSVNTRNYTMMTKSGDWQQLRVGTRVPVQADKGVQYMDVGLSVDCRILEGPAMSSALVTKAEITSFAGADSEKSATGNAPLVRHVQMNASAPLTVGKPVVISGVDELNSKHRFQLEVTATEMK